MSAEISSASNQPIQPGPGIATRMATADSITLSEFKDALGRYRALIQSISKPAKPGSNTLEELDKFRYIDAPSRFSKAGDSPMELADIQKLVDWKLRHGTFRPTLTQQVASNSEEAVKEATIAGFSHHAANPSDVAQTLELLTKPLKGIGPATGSLILAVRDPENVIFFSDEAYRWLVKSGEKDKILYKTTEFEELFAKAKELQNRLKVSPIEIEQVAYVIVKENEPVKESKPETPSNRGRGRPRLPESEKKVKTPAVPGRGRGRPKGSTKVPPKIRTGEPRKRGRPPGSTKAKKMEAAVDKGEVTADGEEQESPSAKRVKV